MPIGTPTRYGPNSTGSSNPLTDPRTETVWHPTAICHAVALRGSFFFLRHDVVFVRGLRTVRVQSGREGNMKREDGTEHAFMKHACY